MFSNQLHLLTADEQEALIVKFGRNVQIHQDKIEASGPIVTVKGQTGQYILIDMDDSIEVKKLQAEPKVKLPRTNRSIEDLLG